MKYLDINGLVKYTTLSRSTIYRYIQNNSIPSIIVGRRRIFVVSEIDEWINTESGRIIDELPAIKGV
jgi:excisionase family DNA binding protein